MEPKLEIYKVTIRHKSGVGGRITFRDFVRKRPEYLQIVGEKTADAMFVAFFKNFVNHTDRKGYHQNEKKLKGFRFASYKDDQGQIITKISKPQNANFTLHGVLEGGAYGRHRKLGKIVDHDESTPINLDNIVADQFFFLLHAPIDSNEGILMIQGYTDARIADVFLKHIADYFKGSETKCDFTYYLPERLKDQFLTGAKLKGFTFTTGIPVKGGFDDDIPNEYEFQVKVEIVDKNPKVSIEDYDKIMMALGSSTFTIHNEKRALGNFMNSAAKITTRKGQDIPIRIENKEIRPTIYLKDVGVQIDYGPNPLFKDVQKYCLELLEEIKKEMYPDYAIEEL